MADKKFGVKQINLIGASGTPTLTSPNNLNINAANVAISTDISVGGRIVGTSTSNVIPFLYNTYSDLPSASTYHGAFAHVHESGKALYAHSSSWFEIVNKESNGTVGTGTEVYSVGSLAIPGGTGTSNRIEIGDSREFTFQYNTSTTKGIISAAANPIDIQATTIKLLPNAGENGVIVNQNGSVELYHANSKKFETTGGTGAGVTVFGTTETQQLNVTGVSTFQGNATFQSNVRLDDGDKLILGSNLVTNDIEIYHGGSLNNHGYVTANTGNLYLTGGGGGGGGAVRLRGYNTDNIIVESSLVNICYSGSAKITTQDYGITVTGVCSATSFYGDASLAVSGKWTLGANGSSDYTFTGTGIVGTENDPVIYLARGAVYEFVNNSGGSHPFQIRQSNGGSAYNTGVTNNGASSGTIRFEVPFSAPNTLYYQCTSHSGMGNNIVVYPTV